VDKELYLPREWTEDEERLKEAGVPEERGAYQSKTDLALSMLLRAKAWGHRKRPLRHR